MALHEYFCETCQMKFEQIVAPSEPNPGNCPKCQTNKTSRRLISKFAVGGQGDLRESTMHGCHGEHLPGEAHDHDE